MRDPQRPAVGDFVPNYEGSSWKAWQFLFDGGDDDDWRDGKADDPHNSPQHRLIAKRERQFWAPHPHAFSAAEHDAADSNRRDGPCWEIQESASDGGVRHFHTRSCRLAMDRDLL